MKLEQAGLTDAATCPERFSAHIVGRDKTPESRDDLMISNGVIVAISDHDSSDTPTNASGFSLPDGWSLAPGLVDLQVNGANGIHLATAPERLEELALALPASGVTTFLPTLPSPTLDEATQLAESVAKVTSNPDPSAARIHGIHLEGPAISPARAGAHPIDRLVSPLEMQAFLELEKIALITIAPELDGARELTEKALALGVTVAAGHTEASFETGVTACDS